MTKTELKKNLNKLSEKRAKEILREIIVDCIWEGRKMMTSDEILNSVCDTLRENGLDSDDNC